MSAATHPQPQVDFLKGEPHRKHPGVTNLKTLRLPEELHVAAQSIIHSKLSVGKSVNITDLSDQLHWLKPFASRPSLHL